ncbi:MipA/OmpV family protein [Yoonia litorea]|uniref:Outer membrane scaffolding protein for murein synthesis, MipA/OmpV family n=1 Tax=Yoonia litorea TaxID=1123755 RepID=A0A1I6MGZ1_9RHOB|nr:MipA/OmpV family protein [Yoonia litorea]SFS14903.1 Outer membrane scaffolding protein for murein synthesis, MipA/OmpV family [Yoonia litorea]
MRAFILSLMILSVASPAVAQENKLTFRLGFGPEYAPAYPGSDEMALGLGTEFTLERLQFGGIAIGGEQKQGFGATGSFRLVEGRSDENSDDLSGLREIDPSVELGGGLTYDTAQFTGFAAVRYGVIGHESFVAEIGGDVIFYPSADLKIAFGPRTLWGDADYVGTYFGVSSTEADATDFEAYDPDAGLVSTGLSVEATYSISDEWEVVGSLRYDLLQGDAADSPLSQDDTQITTSVAITRLFSFDF